MRETQPFVVLAIVVTATFMQLVDVSIVNVAIPSIQRQLHASYAAVQLVVAGYQLGFACTLITGARLGDIYGRKRLFIIGMIGFTSASVLCGAAPNPGTLVLARVLLGVMSGLMFPQVLSIIQVTFAPEDRGRALAVVGAVIGLATIVGPLAGGGLIALNIANLDWRWIFYVNVPVGVIAGTAAFFRLHESRSPDAPRLDIPGALLVSAGLFLLVYPLTEGRQMGWPVWVLVMLGCALPAFALYAVYEARRTKQGRWPLLHVSLFKDKAFRTGSVLLVVFFAGVAPFFFVITLYLQIGFGFSALHAGLTTFPFAVGSALGSAASEKLTLKIGKRILNWGSLVLAAGMLATIAGAHAAGIHLSSWELVPALFASGVGLGLFVAPVLNLILAGIRSAAAGSASGVLSTAQQVGGVLGIAVIGVIFFGLLGSNARAATDAVTPELRNQLAAAQIPAAAADQVVAGFSTCFSDRAHSSDPTSNPPSCQQIQRRLAASPAPPATKQAVYNAVVGQAAPDALRHDFSRTIQQTLLYEVGVYALAFVVVLFLPDVRLGNHHVASTRGRGGAHRRGTGGVAPRST